MTQQRGHFFLNINNDVGLLQLFLQALVFPFQLFIFRGQRMPLRPGAPFLGKGLVDRAGALFAPAVQGGGINPFPPQNGTHPTAVGQGAVGSF